MTNPRKKMSEKYLRELIREEIMRSSSRSLQEMDYNILNGTTFKAAFVDPIADIYHVLVGRAKEIAYGIKQLTRVAFEGTIEMLTFGIFEAEFDEINRDYARDLSRVKSEYAETASRGWKALLQNDIFIAGMLFNPGAAILIKALKEDKELAKNLVTKSPTNIESDPWVVDAKAVEKTRMIVNSYFDTIKKNLRNIANISDITQLRANPQASQQLNKQLNAVEENSKDAVEEETLEAVKTKVFVKVMKMLKDERAKLISMMQQAGVKASEISDVDSLPSRYEKEIFEIARIGGISGQV